MIHVILGPDPALSRRYLDTLLAQVDPGAFNTTVLEAAENAPDGLIAAVAAAPFLGGERVVVIRGLIGKSASGSEAESGPASGSKATSKAGRGTATVGLVLAARAATTRLVLYEPDLAELPAAAKRALPEEAVVRSHAVPRGEPLVSLVVELASQAGSSIDRPVARALLEQLFPVAWRQEAQNRAFDRPPSAGMLMQEVAKLALFAHPESIGASHIQDLAPTATEERLFPLLDATVKGDRRRALVELASVLESGEEIAKVAAQLFQQIELAAAAAAPGAPRDPLEAGRQLGLPNPARMKVVARNVTESESSPSELVRHAAEGDRRLKTGQLADPIDAVVSLVARIGQ